MKTRYFLLLLLWIVTVSTVKAQDDNTTVYFPTSDTEKENWSTQKDENGGIDLIYNGNRRVTDIYAVRFVDLGVVVDGKRVKFASLNIGAKNPWEAGNYYVSGDLGDDIAAQTFGSGFSMPTADDWAALYNNCEWKWVTGYNGTNANGYAVFKRKASGVYSVEKDKHIFLPASGGENNGKVVDAGKNGWYWSTPANHGSVLGFHSTEISPSETSNLSYAFPVRPVIKKTASIFLDKAEVMLSVNGKEKLTATTPNSDGKTVVWKSDDESIAIVDANGNVTGVSTGVTTITATIGNETITCIVTVKIPVTGVTLSGAEYANPYIWGSENVLSKTFTAAVTPDNATDKTVTWESSHPDIIEVAQSGEVKIIAPNETGGVLDVTISAISNDDNTVKGEYVIHLDNYVDLGTGEVYWKAAQESGKYYYDAVKNNFGLFNIPSYNDYNRLIERCELQGNKILNTNRSCAYIKWQSGNYWSNTYKRTSGSAMFGKEYNYCFVANSSGNYRIDEADLFESALLVRCIRRYEYEYEASAYIGRTVNLTLHRNFTGQTITWSSSNNSVATVNSSGVVTGVSEGMVTITAKTAGYTERCIVKVLPVLVTKITVEGDFNKTYNPYIWGVSGESSSQTMRLAIEPFDATNKKVTWSSSHPDIAAVDENGIVTIVGPNETSDYLTVRITATAQDGSGVYGYYNFDIANYVDLGTDKYWYAANKTLNNTFVFAWDIANTFSLPTKEDYEKLLNADNYLWTHTSTVYTVTNKSTGVYINFPLVGNNGYDCVSDGYWTSTDGGVFSYAKYGLTLRYDAVFKDIPIVETWKTDKWAFPAREVMPKPQP